MYEKFIALALVLAANVNGQDEEVADLWEQTPMPDMDHDVFTEITIPDDETFGDFVNNIDNASFGLWDDSDNADIADWIDQNDFTDAGFGEPTLEVFGGHVGFIEPFSSEQSTVVCIYASSYDEKAWCASTDFDTTTIDPADLPEDGEGVWSLDEIGNTKNNDVEFDTEAGAGIGQEFAHYYDTETNMWCIWWWNDGSEGDWIDAEHEFYFVQFGVQAGTEFTFMDTLDIMLMGASHLAAASIASATVLYALI